MPATSSALGLADLALTWSDAKGSADLSLVDDDLAVDISMETAVLLSLFIDRRAFDDDALPTGDPDDRRGWWGDAFADNEGDKIGSRRWLLDRAKMTPDLPRQLEAYDREALAWMIEDGVASSIDIVIDVVAPGKLFETITINRPGRDAISFRYSHVWDT